MVTISKGSNMNAFQAHLFIKIVFRWYLRNSFSWHHFYTLPDVNFHTFTLFFRKQWPHFSWDYPTTTSGKPEDFVWKTNLVKLKKKTLPNISPPQWMKWTILESHWTNLLKYEWSEFSPDASSQQKTADVPHKYQKQQLFMKPWSKFVASDLVILKFSLIRPNSYLL